MIEVKRVIEGITIEEFFQKFGFNSKQDVKDRIKTLLRYGVVFTHSGKEFHGDEVFALALLELYRQLLNKECNKEFYPPFKIIRERNISLEYPGLRIDVDSSFLDHHFPKTEAAFRTNGIQYASVGLLWYVIGEDLVGNNADNIDKELIQGLDASDNGQNFEFAYSNMISLFVPNWNEENLTTEEQMQKAIDFAMIILERFFAKYKALDESIHLVETAYNNAINKEIVILPQALNWQKVLVPTEAKFVIWENEDKQWNCQAVPIEVGSFALKKGFKQSWRGLRNEELKELSGLDLVFCHSSGFFLVANTKETAIDACLIALNEEG